MNTDPPSRGYGAASKHGFLTGNGANGEGDSAFYISVAAHCKSLTQSKMHFKGVALFGTCDAALLVQFGTFACSHQVRSDWSQRSAD
jgi:hypothetical protein